MKTKIEDIKLSKQNQERLEKELKQIGSSGYGARKSAIRRCGGYVCCICDNPATKNMIYKKDDADIVERYCNTCLEKISK